jgi:hypothetical protein
MSSANATTYSTSDIALAAYLKLKGMRLVECGKDGQKFRFVFEDPDSEGAELALEFVNSDFRRYDDEIRSLKKVLYSSGSTATGGKKGKKDMTTG